MLQQHKDYLFYCQASFGGKKYRVSASSLPKALKYLFKEKGNIKVLDCKIGDHYCNRSYLTNQILKARNRAEKEKKLC